jgi:hypothetical protein
MQQVVKSTATPETITTKHTSDEQKKHNKHAECLEAPWLLRIFTQDELPENLTINKRLPSKKGFHEAFETSNISDVPKNTCSVFKFA